MASPRTRRNQISYFADGDKIFLGRRAAGIGASFVLIVQPPKGVTKTLPMWSDPPAQPGHERSINSPLAELCDHLTVTQTKYPGTNLTLRYETKPGH